MKSLRLLIWCLILVCGAGLVSAAQVYSCKFVRDGWQTNNWIIVKSPRWEFIGAWLQKDNCIQNKTPENASKDDLAGKLAPEIYTSMVYGKIMTNNVVVHTTLEFDDRDAPLVVIAPDLGQSKTGCAEYREHYEIVFYHKGVNIWHHIYKDGKPSWEKVAYWNFPLKAQTQYKVEVRKDKKMLRVSVDGHEFGYLDESLPDTFYVGVTACEGINRFYDFQIDQ